MTDLEKEIIKEKELKRKLCEEQGYGYGHKIFFRKDYDNDESWKRAGELFYKNLNKDINYIRHSKNLHYGYIIGRPDPVHIWIGWQVWMGKNRKEKE